MSRVVNTDISSTMRTGMNRTADAQAMHRMATSMRGMQGGNDAIGIAMAERYRSEMRANNAVAREAGNAVSLAQVADKGLDQAGTTLARMQDLAAAAQSDTVGDEERSRMNGEFQKLAQALTATAKETSYNGSTLLDGSLASGLTVSLGDAAATIRLGDSSAEGLGLNNTTVASSAGAQSAQERIAAAMQSIAGQRVELGATRIQLEEAVTQLDGQGDGFAAAAGRLAENVQQTTGVTGQQINSQARDAMLAQASGLNMDSVRMLLRQ